MSYNTDLNLLQFVPESELPHDLLYWINSTLNPTLENTFDFSELDNSATLSSFDSNDMSERTEETHENLLNHSRADSQAARALNNKKRRLLEEQPNDGYKTCRYCAVRKKKVCVGTTLSLKS
jgi:hypothetical protein